MSRDVGQSNPRAAGNISISIPTRDVANIARKTYRCAKIMGGCAD